MKEEKLYPILPEEFSCRVRIKEAVKHEDRTFKPGALGYCLNTKHHCKKHKYPVWLASVQYPVYLEKEQMKEI